MSFITPRDLVNKKREIFNNNNNNNNINTNIIDNNPMRRVSSMNTFKRDLDYSIRNSLFVDETISPKNNDRIETKDKNIIFEDSLISFKDIDTQTDSIALFIPNIRNTTYKKKFNCRLFTGQICLLMFTISAYTAGLTALQYYLFLK